MTFEATEGRFGAFVDAVRARYPVLGTDDDPAWFCGAEHANDNDNWHRIVAWSTEGTIGPPRGMGAAVSKTGTAVASRALRATFQVWGPSRKVTENELHGLIEAIDYVSGSADNVVGGMRERWFVRSGVIHEGGAMVEISFDLLINVLESDRLVLLEGRAVGLPATPTPADTLIVVGALDGAELPPVVTEKDP